MLSFEKKKGRNKEFIAFSFKIINAANSNMLFNFGDELKQTFRKHLLKKRENCQFVEM